MASFKCPDVVNNPGGWGPCTLPEQFKDIPYQPFSKADRLGRAADFTNSAYMGRRDRYASQFGAGGDIFAYYEENDESSFQLVDTSKAPKTFRKKTWQNRNLQRIRRDERRMGGTMQMLSRGGVRDRDRQRQERKLQKRWAGRRRWTDRTPVKVRDPSVEVQSSWKPMEELETGKFSKLSAKVDKPEDLLLCGSVQYYDKTWDRINTKSEKPLHPVDRTHHNVTTTDDPHIRKYSQSIKGANVFATDTILSQLMASSRSVYSWDIVVHRVQDKLFFDKRDDNDADLLTVNETAQELPQEEGDHYNSPERLSLEATYLNQMFGQRCLKKQTKDLPEPNPFSASSEEEEGQAASVAYRYRKWNLGDGLTLVCRCTHDAVLQDAKHKDKFINVKTLNEWNPKSGVDWRQKLDVQRGAVLATELKNNGCKLAKWTLESILAGSAALKLGYVTRNAPNDPQHHVVLGVQQFKPTEIAKQINLNLENAWGVLQHFVKMLMKMPEGKYVILKDPMKPLVRIYSVPRGTFEDDDDEDDDSEEDDEDDDDEEEDDEGAEAAPAAVTEAAAGRTVTSL
eukprot:m.50997 g.50997  ORF g.50997 m.50997 type:complete len:568 (+) comp12190_c0_seq2:178-1881(+)